MVSVFQRFPTLQVVLSEGGIGWVPMLLDRLDYVMSHSGAGGGLAWDDELSPSEVLLRNFSFCMLDDPSTLPVLDRIGSERVMVEVDYPHSDTTWPDSQAVLRAELADPAAGLSDEDIGEPHLPHSRGRPVPRAAASRRALSRTITEPDIGFELLDVSRRELRR